MDTERRRRHGDREKKKTWIKREEGDMDTERRRRHGDREKK